MTKHATYIGPDCGWNVTKGLKALIMPSDKPGVVLAQFDDFWVARSGRHLCFGWHEFPEGDFQLDNIEVNTLNSAYQLMLKIHPSMDKFAVVEYYPNSPDVFAYQFFQGEKNIGTFIPDMKNLQLQNRPYSLAKEHLHFFEENA